MKVQDYQFMKWCFITKGHLGFDHVRHMKINALKSLEGVPNYYDGFMTTLD